MLTRGSEPGRSRTVRGLSPTLAILLLLGLVANIPAVALARGWLGISVQDVTEAMREAMDLGTASGALVSDVNPGSPAENAGIRAGDVIIRIEGHPVEATGDLIDFLRGRDPGDQIDISILRNDAERTIQATLGPEPGPDEKLGGIDRILPRFDTPGPVKPLGRGATLGIRVHDLDEHLAPYFDVDPEEGVLVLSVAPASPAADSGLLPGDVITEMNGEPVATVQGLRAQIDRLSRGDDWKASIVRKGERMEMSGRIERGWEHPPRLGQTYRRFDENRSKGSALLGRAERRLEREMERLRLRIRDLERRLERMERR